MAACALDGAGVQRQRERYAQIGARARVLSRTPRRLVASLAGDVDAGLVAETLAIERECCPFFELVWAPDSRRLTVSVADAEHEAALAAIAFALGLAE